MGNVAERPRRKRLSWESRCDIVPNVRDGVEVREGPLTWWLRAAYAAPVALKIASRSK